MKKMLNPRSICWVVFSSHGMQVSTLSLQCKKLKTSDHSLRFKFWYCTLPWFLHGINVVFHQRWLFHHQGFYFDVNLVAENTTYCIHHHRNLIRMRTIRHKVTPSGQWGIFNIDQKYPPSTHFIFQFTKTIHWPKMWLSLLISLISQLYAKESDILGKFIIGCGKTFPINIQLSF